MRIVAWNVNHRSRKRVISPAVPRAILSLRPDVVVLTEYVETPGHADFCAILAEGGLDFHCQTPIRAGHNQVLIASRLATTPGTISPPSELSHATSNCLHVRVAEASLELLGLRVPMFDSAADRQSYWSWFESGIQPLLSRHTVIIGDLNVNLQRVRDPASRHLRRIAGSGWQLLEAEGPASYTSVKGSTSCLDHALVSPTITVSTAAYVAEANGYRFMGSGRDSLSDHAPLVLDITAIGMNVLTTDMRIRR